MARACLVDAYNVLLQDERLDDLVHRHGLEEARRVFRGEVEAFGRREGIQIRLIFDGAREPFDHRDAFESAWVQVSFTGAGESADDRIVAVALEMKRKGHAVLVVSDDEAGVRRPLQSAGVTLQASRDFVRAMRSRPAPIEERAEALSAEERQALARGFLARDAERQRREAELRRKGRGRGIPEATPVPAPRPAPRPAAPKPVVAESRPAGPPPDRRAALEDKRSRGARKQARRLNQLQNRKKNR